MRLFDTAHRSAYLLMMLLTLVSGKVFGQRDGSLDTSFDPNLEFNSYILNLFLQNDGKVVISGYFTTIDNVDYRQVARLKIDGTPDTSFNPGSGTSYIPRCAIAQPDGKIIVGGWFSSFNGRVCHNIARLNVDGSVDTSFNASIGVNDSFSDPQVYYLTLQADGKIYVGGSFSNVNGVRRFCLARLNADGTLDISFNSGSLGGGGPVTIQPDGKLLTMSIFYSGNQGNLLRLNTDGSLDSNFNAPPSIVQNPYSLALQPDGKILVGGAFEDAVSSLPHPILRLNSDGSQDTSFRAVARSTTDPLSSSTFSNVGSIIIQPNGKIIVGGMFDSINGTNRNSIARLNGDGSLDSTFDLGRGFNSGLVRLAQQPDGKIIAAGGFSSYNGQSCGKVIRINNALTIRPPKPNIQVSGDSVMMGSVIIDSTKTGFLTIRNTGDTTLIISSSSISNSAYSTDLSSGTVAPGDSLSITVRFSPIALGIQTGILTLATNDYAHSILRITLAGTGIAAPVGKLSASVDSLWIPAVGLGGTSTASFRVRNIGTAPFAVLTLTSSNQYFSVTPTSFGPLAVGDSVPVSVTFQPITLSPQSSTVTVRADGVDSVKVVFLSTQITGLNEVRSRSLSPNPGHPGQTLHLSEAGNTLHLTDIQGRSVATLTERKPGQYVLPVDIGPGYYLLTSERGQRYRLCIAPQ